MSHELLYEDDDLFLYYDVALDLIKGHSNRGSRIFDDATLAVFREKQWVCAIDGHIGANAMLMTPHPRDDFKDVVDVVIAARSC